MLSCKTKGTLGPFYYRKVQVCFRGYLSASRLQLGPSSQWVVPQRENRISRERKWIGNTSLSRKRTKPFAGGPCSRWTSVALLTNLESVRSEAQEEKGHPQHLHGLGGVSSLGSAETAPEVSEDGAAMAWRQETASNVLPN